MRGTTSKVSTQRPHTYSELDFSKNYTEINDHNVG